MVRLRTIIYLQLLTFGLAACNKTSLNTDIILNDNTLKIGAISFSDCKQDFQEGDAIGIYVYNYPDSIYLYDNNNPEYGNIKCTYTSGNWELERTVKLTNEMGKVYAYYPYDESFEPYHGWTMRVELGELDYLMGKSSAWVNGDNDKASIVMKHSCPMLRFLVRKMTYNSEGNFTSLTITNYYTENVIYRYGFNNCVVGKLTNIGRYGTITKYVENHTITDFYPLPEDENCVVIYPSPIENPLQANKIVYIQFSVDNKTYNYDLPEGTLWEAGKIYTYYVTLSSEEPEEKLRSSFGKNDNYIYLYKAE